MSLTPRLISSSSSWLLFLFSFSLFFFLLFESTANAEQNEEASVLYTWLHSSSSRTPSHSLSLFNWNNVDTSPCNNWTFVTCSSQGFVTEINIQSTPLELSLPDNLPSFRSLQKLVISGSNLTGELPTNIGDCQSLNLVDFSSNSLMGSIPSSIGRLQHLESLILNSNQLTGEIPLEIGDCLNLKNLFIFDNLLGGEIPSELTKLSALEVIRAGGNRDINGRIPPEIGDCTNLTVLGLAETGVSGSLPTSLGKLRNLQTLSIYTTKISGEIPSDLGNCSELVDIFLYENSLSGPIPSEIGKLGKLEQLLLWQNSLAGGIPEEIGNCSNLRIADFSLNSLSGSIPLSIGSLTNLEEFMISNNNVSGSIPANLSNCTNLLQLQLDTNRISGLIPPEIGMISGLNVFFAWQNQLEGSVPSSLTNCTNLQALDLSHNSLTGTIPGGLFNLQNLTKLLLIFNDLSGFIPNEIGSCKSLVRLRLGNNRILGGIPRGIGGLKKLNFLDLSSNRLSGLVPDDIGGCLELQMMDLSNNSLEGPLPISISSLSSLQVLDVSANKFRGEIPASLGRLVSLNKLILSKNALSGSIPTSLSLCSNLQLLDLSSNELTGNIPLELGQIEALEIALNLSCNKLTGSIPVSVSSLNKLSVLDLSHNMLEGDLDPLARLDNLVSLNISYNSFTGYLPDNKLFRQLSSNDLEGNKGLCSSASESCFLSGTSRNGLPREEMRTKKLRVTLALLITATVVMVIMGAFAVIRARRNMRDGVDSELGDSFTWQFTPFQKLNISVEQILRCLVDTNVIGKGCSGMVYRADIDNAEAIAVKKLWPATTATTKSCFDENGGVRDSFSTEVKTLGSIRHKNIVRLLGYCWNKNTRLLMYDYMPNGSLGSLLHERHGMPALDWDLRYQILLGAAQGVAYLHHDCVPPIVHRDIKANNILIGLQFEPYIADFGIAKLVDDGDFGRASNTIAGSYGYIAPEYGYMMKITEKSDVYSYGVVVLEVLTGKQPIDPTIPEGIHLVDWVRQRRGGMEVLDPSLQSRPESEAEEIMQALGIGLLCVNPTPEERPTMKDVAAMLKEIKQEREEYAKVDLLLKKSPATSSVANKRKETSCSRPNNISLSASSLLHSSSSI